MARALVVFALVCEGLICLSSGEVWSQLLGGILALAALGIVGEALLSWLLGWRRL